VDAVYDDDIQLQFADSCGRNILRSAQQQLMAVIARHLPSNFNKLQILTFTMLDIYEKNVYYVTTKVYLLLSFVSTISQLSLPAYM